MTWAPDRATRLLVLLASISAGLLGNAVSASPTVGTAALLAALTALVLHTLRQVCVAGYAQPVALVESDARTPLLAGRVTDPTHHPLRPRAPGLG
ncbi:hypothetical protein GCM10009795_019840 [Nocardioides hankookensis]|uniref:DUF58 domain-containing protein n=1 Tax=Nocardioides hankookensis TaxID=443157 RepID=A0ABW1LLK8_9ACTN